MDEDFTFLDNRPIVHSCPETIGTLAMSLGDDGSPHRFCMRTCQEYVLENMTEDWEKKINDAIEDLNITTLILVGKTTECFVRKCIKEGDLKIKTDYYDTLYFPCSDCDRYECEFTKARLSLRRALKRYHFKATH
ncbi:hypothetical protein TNCT_229541 [Trichonephila clavata]|uniref:Uncharacterized protein n=1 Tax=Trichonephila clavata TaxID=2740835 RepID=A0A8X6G3A2_TRICU|nr:hypothetical protein TNCT_556081 [Trichonephila clavata]GFR12286.1 hypothetical protein TNCT_103471 [Trichonephila clavata]GFR29523.1 hypothetical protein TNCT_229541 [Trichonephila clavata]